MCIPVRTFPNQYFYSPIIYSKILVLCLHLTLWFIHFYFCMWCRHKSVKFLFCTSVQFSRSVMFDSTTPSTAAAQASLSITNSQSLLKLMLIESVMPSNHLILCHPFSSCLQFFPASGSFPVSQFFLSSGQSIGASASASVFPMNIQDWLLLGWTGWISLLSKGLSIVFSNTTVQKHWCSVLSLLYGPTLTSIHDS